MVLLLIKIKEFSEQSEKGWVDWKWPQMGLELGWQYAWFFSHGSCGASPLSSCATFSCSAAIVAFMSDIIPWD